MAYSTEQKIDKLEKIRRLEEEQLRFFLPHNKQEELLSSDAEIRAVFWGNQGGKSYAGAMDCVMTVGKVHPYRKNKPGSVYARVCCESESVLHAVHIPLFKKILPRKPCLLGGEFVGKNGNEYRVPTKTYEGEIRKWPGLKGGSWDTAYDKQYNILYLDNGSFFEFKTYKQDVQSFAGPPRHYIWHDEEPPQAIYNENQARQVTVGVDILFTMTPINYSAWLYSDVYEKSATTGKIYASLMSSSDNPYADNNVLESMAENITDPVVRAARLHGEFTYASGRVLSRYGAHNLIDVKPIPKEWHRSVIIDPHPQKPTAVNWVAEDYEGKLYFYKEASYEGDVKQICNQIFNDNEGGHIDLWLIDPSSRQSAQIRGKGSLIDEFRQHIPYIIEANNDVLLGVDTMRSMIGTNEADVRLFVMRSCPTTDFQLKNTSWQPPTKTGEDRSRPKIVKRNDDHFDNARYRCMWRSGLTMEQIQPWNITMYGN